MYTPVYISATEAGESALPSCFSKGSLFKFDHVSSFWRFAAVGNWLARWFKYAIHDVRAVQESLEDQLFEEMAGVEAAVSAAGAAMPTAAAAASLTAVSQNHASRFMASYSKLFEDLITRYHDGCEFFAGVWLSASHILQLFLGCVCFAQQQQQQQQQQIDRLEDPEAVTIKMDKLFYPKWYLTVAGFFRYKEAPQVPGTDDDPVRVAQHADGSSTDDAAPLLSNAAYQDSQSGGWSLGLLVLSHFFVAAVAVAATATCARHQRQKGADGGGFVEVTMAGSESRPLRAGRLRGYYKQYQTIELPATHQQLA